MHQCMNVRQARKLFAMRLERAKVLESNRAFAGPDLAHPLEVRCELLSSSLAPELPFSSGRKIAIEPARAIFLGEVRHVHMEMHSRAKRERNEPRSGPEVQLCPYPATPFRAAHSAALLALPAREAGKMQSEASGINPEAMLRLVIAAGMERS